MTNMWTYLIKIKDSDKSQFFEEFGFHRRIGDMTLIEFIAAMRQVISLDQSKEYYFAKQETNGDLILIGETTLSSIKSMEKIVVIPIPEVKSQSQISIHPRTTEEPLKEIAIESAKTDVIPKLEIKEDPLDLSKVSLKIFRHLDSFGSLMEEIKELPEFLIQGSAYYEFQILGLPERVKEVKVFLDMDAKGESNIIVRVKTVTNLQKKDNIFTTGGRNLSVSACGIDTDIIIGSFVFHIYDPNSGIPISHVFKELKNLTIRKPENKDKDFIVKDVFPVLYKPKISTNISIVGEFGDAKIEGLIVEGKLWRTSYRPSVPNILFFANIIMEGFSSDQMLYIYADGKIYPGKRIAFIH